MFLSPYYRLLIVCLFLIALASVACGIKEQAEEKLKVVTDKISGGEPSSTPSASGQSGTAGQLGVGWDTLTFSGISSDADINEAISWKGPWINSFKPDADKETPSDRSRNTPVVVNLGSKGHQGIPLGTGLVISFPEPRQELRITLWAGERSREVSVEVLDSNGISLESFDRSSFEETGDRSGTLTVLSESENLSTVLISPVSGSPTEPLSGFHLDRLSFKPSNDELAAKSTIWQAASEELVKQTITSEQQTEAIKKLMGFPSQKTLQTLREAANSTNNIEVKKKAVLAIAEYPDRASIDDLYQIGMNGRDPDLKMAVTQAIWAIGQNYPPPDLPQVEFDIRPVDERGDYVELTATLSSPVHWDSLVANFERTTTANTLSRNSYSFPTGATDLQYRHWETETKGALESILEVAGPEHSLDDQQYVGPIGPKQPIQLKAYYSTEADAGEMPLRFKVDISQLEVYKKDYIVYFDKSQNPPIFSLEPLPGMDSGFWEPKASAPANKPVNLLASPLSAGCVMNTPKKVRLEGRILFQDGDSKGKGGAKPLVHIEFGSPDWVTLGEEYKPAKPAKIVTVIASDPCYRNPWVNYWAGGRGDTDDQGYFSFLAYLTPGNKPKLNLIVENSHADIYADTDCINERLPHSYTGEIVPVGIGNNQAVQMGTHEVKLEYEVVEVSECTLLGIGSTPDLTLSFASTLNVNDVIYTSKREVLAARSPSAGDGISQVTVEYCDRSWNYYYTDIVLTCPFEEGSWDMVWPPHKWFVQYSKPAEGTRYDYGLVDETIIHEYVHHLQYEIGTWDAHAGGHQMCVPESSAPLWLTSDTSYKSEMAWSEGFASYLARYITFKHADLMSEVGIKGSELEDPEEVCDEIFPNPQIVEGPIIEVLWDLTDGWGSLESGYEYATYTIKQKSTERYVDAWEKSDKDYRLVTRDKQPNDSQRWILDPVLGTADDNTYTIKQKINGRFVEAGTTSKELYSLVTREPNSKISQNWILNPLGDGTYEIQQESSGQFVDAHETGKPGGKDHGLFTAYKNHSDSQKWIVTHVDPGELWDQVDGSFSKIIQIFDEDLDLGSAWGGAEAPTFADFYEAWRPINPKGLDAILANLGFVPHLLVPQTLQTYVIDEYFFDSQLILGAEASFSERVTPTAEDAIVDAAGNRPEYDKKPIYTYRTDSGNEPVTIVSRRYSYAGSEYLEKYLTVDGRGSEVEDNNVMIYAGVTNLGDGNLPLFPSEKPSGVLDDTAIFSDFVIEPKEGTVLPPWLLTSNGIFEKNLLKGIELTINLANLVGEASDPKDMGKVNIKTLASDPGKYYTADLVLKAFVRYSGSPSYEKHLPIKNIKVTLTIDDGPRDDIDDDGIDSHHEIFYDLLEGIPVITATLLAKNPVSFCPDPTDPDSDRDRLKDGEEFKIGTSPCHQDTDEDELSDFHETFWLECMDPLIPRNYGNDYDNDGLTDEEELGINSNSISNPCDGDSDKDKIQDGDDNCVNVANTDQINTDEDLYGDKCDEDDDNDLCPDNIDPQPLIPNYELASECQLSLFKYKTSDGNALNLGEWIGYLHSLFNPVREEYMILAVNPEGFSADSCDQRACPPPQLVLFNDQLQEVTRFEAYAYGLGLESAFGSAVSWIPDIDGDGIHDFAVGAPSAFSGSTGVQTGAVLLLSSQNGKELGRIDGVYEGGQFGSSIAFLGGSSIAIGAPSSNRTGMVAIADLDTLDLSQQILGKANDSRFGQTIFGVADLDNDGTNDLLIGAPHDQGSGSVYIGSIAKGTTTALIQGEYQGEGVGMALAAQWSESPGEQIAILVGSPDFRGTGRVIKMTPAGDIIWESLGTSIGSEYGTSLSVSRTIGASGIDVLVGAPGNDGGKGTVYSLNTGGEVIRKIPAPESTSRFGQGVLLRERTADSNQHDVLISPSQSPSEWQEDNSSFVYRSSDR